MVPKTRFFDKKLGGLPSKDAKQPLFSSKSASSIGFPWGSDNHVARIDYTYTNITLYIYIYIHITIYIYIYI